MATIKLYLKNPKRSLTKIYVRISLGRNHDINFPLDQVINPIHWDNVSQQVRRSYKDYNVLNETLDNIRQLFEDLITMNYYQKELLTTTFFKNYYKNYLFNSTNSDKNYLDVLEFMVNYYENLKLSGNTKSQYLTTINKVRDYINYTFKTDKLFYSQINNKWAENFIDYLLTNEDQKLGADTINTYLSKLRIYFSKYAELNRLFKKPEFKDVKVSESLPLPYFSENDLALLENFEFDSERLSNVRDWVIIGCETGLRISDFGSLEGIELAKEVIVALKQQKTGGASLIPISDRLKRVYQKRNGLPPQISDAKFNKYVKEVCEIAGFDTVMYGSKSVNIGKDSNGKNMFRKVHAQYKKFELITSHTCRRSFATNKYLEGKMNIETIMLITGQDTKEVFFNYVQADYLKIQNLKQ